MTTLRPRRYLVHALPVLPALVIAVLASAPSAARAQTPAPTASPAPAPTVSPTPALAPSPTPAPTPAPTPSPPPAPTPTPARIVDIEVRGNRHVATPQILAAVTLKVGDLLDPVRLRRDLDAVIALGWFADATVRVETAPGGQARVVFIVTENPVITDVVVEGNTVVSTEDILRALNVPLGQILNNRQLREGVRAVEALYEGRGYIVARVADAGVVPAGDGRLRLRVAEGRLESIAIKGLTKTQLFVVLRSLTIKPGDVFNVQQVNRDLQALFDLNLFETIQARPAPGSTPDTVVLEIEIKEAQTGSASVGLGYSSEAGLLGSLELRERNWRGRGQDLTLRAERGFQENVPQTTRFEFLLAFREPFLDARRTGVDISLFSIGTVQTEYVMNEPTSRYDLTRTGSIFSLSRPVAPATTIALSLRSELAEIVPLPLDPEDPDSPIVPPTLFTPGRTVSIAVIGTRDMRDNRIAPTRGSRQAVSLEFGLPVLGGDFSFQKAVGEYTQYFPLGGDTVVAGRVIIGAGFGTIPLQEQFVLGGSTTLRGFAAGRFRGNSVALLNVEYRTPLGRVAPFLRDFLGIVFIDAGAAPLVGGEGIQYNAGIGTAFRTPFGVLRLDLGFSREGTRTWVSLGHPF